MRGARIAPLLIALLLLLSLLHAVGLKNFVVSEETGGLGRAVLAALTFHVNWVAAIGTCLVISAAAHSRWSAPWVLSPLTRLGRHSYEVYLTHMFVVFALFGLFRPPVALLFIAVIVSAALLGEVVARVYSEPMNSRLRAQKPTLTPDPNGLY